MSPDAYILVIDHLRLELQRNAQVNAKRVKYLTTAVKYFHMSL